MVKTIKIGNTEYDMKSSAYTVFAYKDQMGRDLLADISTINDTYTRIGKLPEAEQTSEWLKEITGVIEIALKLAYIMIKEQNNQFKDYNEWLKEIDAITGTGNSWIQEVMELAIAPFLGRIQSSQN